VLRQITERLDPSETRQKFRQGTVLSMLLFNVVLERSSTSRHNSSPMTGMSLEAIRDAYLALETKTVKVGLKNKTMNKT
jgi:hypothetical protein